MKRYPASPQPSKNDIRLFPLVQGITSVFFAFLVMSCASYKTIVPGSTDHLSGTAPSIARGNVIRVTMKSGESIKSMKVTAVDSLRIAGIETIHEDGQWKDYSKIITISDIQSIKKRKISAGKTTVLVLILITSPAWIWALSGAPL